MARARHSVAHDPCPYGATSWGACEKARRIAIGQCVSMLDEDTQCSHWGVDTVDGRGYCGQHINSVYLAAVTRDRERARRDAMNARADAFLALTNQAPHVCGDHCVFSSL